MIETITAVKELTGLVGGVLVGGGFMSLIIRRHLAKIDKIEDKVDQIMQIKPLIEFIEHSLNEKVEGIKDNINTFQGRMEKNIEKLEYKVGELVKKE